MSSVLTVGSEEAVKLLEELGIEGAADFSTSKLTNTLKKLPSELEGEEEPDISRKSKKLLDQILEAKGVKVQDSEEEEEEEEPSPKKKKKVIAKAKPSKNGEPVKRKKKKTKSDAAPKDKFGSREGTESSRINSLISKKPISVEKLKSKFPKFSPHRVTSHVRFLTERGYVKVKEGKVVEK
jgi:hypothetical protein